MKTELICESMPSAPSALPDARANVWLGFTIAFLAAASAVAALGAPQQKVDLARLEPGIILITSQPEPAAVSFAAGNRRVESAGEGAASAVRSVLNTPNLGHRQLEAAVGALEFAVAPFAAAYGAISASRQRLPQDRLVEAENELAKAMRAMAGQEHLRKLVAECAGEKTRRVLACGEFPLAGPPNNRHFSAVLETRVEELRLERAGAGGGQHALRIKARARLVRTADGAVLIDRPYLYQSETAMFID